MKETTEDKSSINFKGYFTPLVDGYLYVIEIDEKPRVPIFTSKELLDAAMIAVNSQDEYTIEEIKDHDSFLQLLDPDELSLIIDLERKDGKLFFSEYERLISKTETIISGKIDITGYYYAYSIVTKRAELITMQDKTVFALVFSTTQKYNAMMRYLKKTKCNAKKIVDGEKFINIIRDVADIMVDPTIDDNGALTFLGIRKSNPSDMQPTETANIT